MRLLKMTGIIALFLLILLVLLPTVIVRGCNRGALPPDVSLDPQMVKVWNHRTQELMVLSLGEYLLGVVVAEMPAEFHIEALKAQAIAARTYTINKITRTGCDRHEDADICTDSTHCQAWRDRDEAIANWPFFRQNAYWSKIVRAVSDTQGRVITHEGNLIQNAVYHSTCGGSTENSEDVWTSAAPYLRAVECRYCTHSPRITETQRMTEAEVAEKLRVAPGQLKLNVLDRTASGRIISIDIGNEVIRGLEFRTRLGLRSSRVTWLREQGTYTFTTTGFGHALGMCQYGADGMGKQGFSATEILEFYYTGAMIQRIRLEE